MVGAVENEGSIFFCGNDFPFLWELISQNNKSSMNDAFLFVDNEGLQSYRKRFTNIQKQKYKNTMLYTAHQ
jgi:hypothetical protein